MSTFLQSSRDGDVLTLTMNQPETRNALTGNTAVQELVDACAAITLDAGIRYQVVSPVVSQKKGEFVDLFRELAAAGCGLAVFGPGEGRIG